MTAAPASAAPPPLRIDFVSDVTCPWCAIGLAGLEQAIARLNGAVAVELHFQPFELNPGIAREGEAIADYVKRKHGAGPAELAQRQALIRARGAEAGLALAERSHVYNTFDAHRLLHWAGLEGRQRELKQALLEAYHVRGENPGAPEVLLAAAAAAGLGRQRAGEVITSDEYATEVREAVQRWQRQGITAVPSMVVDGHWLIQGGQSSDVIEQALGRIVAER
jgi:predicted DsbA family dithiol-disulfide isomerase